MKFKVGAAISSFMPQEFLFLFTSCSQGGHTANPYSASDISRMRKRWGIVRKDGWRDSGRTVARSISVCLEVNFFPRPLKLLIWQVKAKRLDCGFWRSWATLGRGGRMYPRSYDTIKVAITNDKRAKWNCKASAHGWVKPRTFIAKGRQRGGMIVKEITAQLWTLSTHIWL